MGNLVRGGHAYIQLAVCRNGYALRRNFKDIKDITLDSVATNRNAATSPSRRVVIHNAEQTTRRK